MKQSNYYAMLKRLVDKDLIIKKEDGSYELTFKLQKFVDFINRSLTKEDVEFDFKFLFKILKTSEL